MFQKGDSFMVTKSDIQQEFPFMAVSDIDEAIMFDRARRGDKVAISKLLKKHEGLVGYNLKKLGLLPTDEHWQTGLIGLWNAIKRYDPYRGTKFSTMSFHWIRQALTRDFRDSGKSKISPQKWSKCKTVYLEECQESARNLSYNESNGSFDMASYDLALIFTQCKVTEKEKDVLIQKANGLSLKAIGKRHGLSQERIRQKISEVLQKIRKYYDIDGIPLTKVLNARQKLNA